MGIVQWRQQVAGEICKECRVCGIPPFRVNNYREGKLYGYYGHSKVQANGCSEIDYCSANKFLKNLDRFMKMEPKEWQNLSTQETGSAK